MSIRLRQAGADEYDWLYQLKRAAFFELVEQTFGPWDEAIQRRYFDNQYTVDRYRIIEVDGEPAGAIALRDEADHVFLAEIQLLPAFQGVGIGSEVIAGVLTDARDCGKPVRLQLLKGNRVLALYRRLGFSLYDATDTHYRMIHNAGLPAVAAPVSGTRLADAQDRKSRQ